VVEAPFVDFSAFNGPRRLFIFCAALLGLPSPTPPLRPEQFEMKSCLPYKHM